MNALDWSNLWTLIAMVGVAVAAYGYGLEKGAR